MTQYIAMLRASKDGDILQTFGPYLSEKAAQDAIERLMDWPAMKIGFWDTLPLYPNPPEHHVAPPMYAAPLYSTYYSVAANPSLTYTYQVGAGPTTLTPGPGFATTWRMVG